MLKVSAIIGLELTLEQEHALKPIMPFPELGWLTISVCYWAARTAQEHSFSIRSIRPVKKLLGPTLESLAC